MIIKSKTIKLREKVQGKLKDGLQSGSIPLWHHFVMLTALEADPLEMV